MRSTHQEWNTFSSMHFNLALKASKKINPLANNFPIPTFLPLWTLTQRQIWQEKMTWSFQGPEGPPSSWQVLYREDGKPQIILLGIIGHCSLHGSMSCQVFGDTTQVNFEVSVHNDVPCTSEERGAQRSMVLGHLLGQGHEVAEICVLAQLSPELGSFCFLFPFPPIYGSFTSPTVVPLAFHSLGVKLTSEASLLNWPTNSRKAPKQIVSLG